MLYPKNNAKALTTDLFQTPTSEYRGTPFWAWNCKLDETELLWQIEVLKEMGFGGFHMHSRDGMAVPYLSDEFMSLVSACVQKAKDENMLAWLYDEDRWPSGAAGGLVTKHLPFRARHMLFTTTPLEDVLPLQQAIEQGKSYLLACFDVVLNKQGELASYHCIDETATPQGTRWFVYVQAEQPNAWYNNQTYIDTLNKQAVDRFIEITYERYKQTVGKEFGKTVPAIFTDEPQFSWKGTLPFSHSKEDVRLSWTPDFPQTFQAEYGYDIVQRLPELLWELPDGAVSQARYHYHDHVTERFASAFADNCGKWCDEHGIALTGHMVCEESLHDQTKAIGEAMRSYRGFALPGIDLLCNHLEYTTAKQAQSAAHQYGREGVMSELYGVTNWDFDFRGHKFQGDWQAALGITVRVPHLSWVSMGGEAKRDYPASIHYQSPWYKEYRYVEDHFARLNTALTRGKPVVRVGVIHPIESYWLHFGSVENTGGLRAELEHQFHQMAEWLLFGQIDFDYICESLLPTQSPVISDSFGVGKMAYSTVVVPGCETLRRSTFELLKQFHQRGGKILFVGECPKYIDALPSDEIASLYEACDAVSFSQTAVLQALEPERFLSIRNTDGTRSNNLLYQLRQDEDCLWLFVAHGKPGGGVDTPRPQKVQMCLKGEHTPLLWDTINGKQTELPYHVEKGCTLIDYTLYEQDSLLLQLLPYSGQVAQPATPPATVQRTIRFPGKVPCTLSEPNVYLLEMAQYALDDEPYTPLPEDVLYAADRCRERVGLPPCVSDRYPQPWVAPPTLSGHTIALRFTVQSEIDVPNPTLAIENPLETLIEWNGQQIQPQVNGYYIDKAIKTLPLPPLHKGENELIVKIPLGSRTAVEWCYLLGDFRVKVEGTEKTIIAGDNRLGFSSVTGQGMPFYSGNITYHTSFELDKESTVRIRANNYRGALIRVAVNGEDKGVIAYSPYSLDPIRLPAGTHTIDFTLFGNRYNSCAAVHLANLDLKWFGPNAWHSEGDEWCYEYRLRDLGILASPIAEVLQP